MTAGWVTDNDTFERLLCCLTEKPLTGILLIHDSGGYLGGLLFPEPSLAACDWNIHMYTHTRRCTHGLIAVPCLSSWLALWKGHLTKPLTGRCNTCVCSELSDTKRHLWALPWQERHCDIWLTDWLTGLGAGWQIKADIDNDTSETVMKKRDRTQIMPERVKDDSYVLSDRWIAQGICQYNFHSLYWHLSAKVFQIYHKRAKILHSIGQV